MEKAKLVGERLKKARIEMKMTQDEIAKKLGVLREQISYFETGSREVTVSTLTELSKIYGKTISYFFEETEKVEPALNVAYRKEGLLEEDIEKIEWAKRFVMNLYELEKI